MNVNPLTVNALNQLLTNTAERAAFASKLTIALRDVELVAQGMLPSSTATLRRIEQELTNHLNQRASEHDNKGALGGVVSASGLSAAKPSRRSKVAK